MRATELRPQTSVVLPLLCGLLVGLVATACAPRDEGAAPAAPTVAPPDSPTAADVLTLRGTKPAGTGIEIADLTVVPLNDETTFVATVPLPREGINVLSVVAFDALDRRSPGTTVNVLLDTTPPPLPAVDVPARPTFQTSWTLTGSAANATSLQVNGEDARAGTNTDWEADVPLALGPNPVRVTARDALGNESAAVSLTLHRAVYAFSVEVAVEVNGTTVAPPTLGGGRWSVNLDLTADAQSTFTVVGEHPERSETVLVEVFRDATLPAVPTLTSVPTLVVGDTVTLVGTKDADSGLHVNGETESLPDGAAAFSIAVAVAPGIHTLTVSAIDDAGNRSAAVTPAPRVYVAPAGLVFTVDPTPNATDSATLPLSGTRNPDLEIWVDGLLATAAGGSTDWSANATLASGANTITVEARVADHVETRTRSVNYLFAAPVAPAPTAPAFTDSTTVAVSGTRPTTAAVFRADGSPVAPLDGSDVFDDVHTLAEGSHTLSYVARDAFGRESPIGSVDVEVDLTPPTVTMSAPIDGVAEDSSVAFAGAVDDGIGVDRVEVCVGSCTAPGDWLVADGTTTWSATFDASALDTALERTLVPVHVRAFDLAGNSTDAPARTLRLFRGPVALSAAAAFSSPSADADLHVAVGGHVAGVFSHDDGGGPQVWIREDAGGVLTGAAVLVSGNAALDSATQPRVRVVDATPHVTRSATSRRCGHATQAAA